MLDRSNIVVGSLFVVTASVILSLSVVGMAAAQSNMSLGTGALQKNTTGSFNIAIGSNALFFNTTGSNNTASGANALLGNTAGDFNTASGVNALFRNTTGNNTGIGFQANVSAIGRPSFRVPFVEMIR